MTEQFPTMLAAWQHQVAAQPDAPAVRFFDAALGYAELDRIADALACGLLDRGLRSNDRVALYLQNDPQFLVGMVAAWKAGAVPVAVSPMLLGEELEHHLTDSGATVLVCLDSLYATVAAEVVTGTDVTTVVTTHPLDLTPDLTLPLRLATSIPERRTFAETLDWTSLIGANLGRRPPETVHQPRPQDMGMLTYTSGTTGRSKGAINLHSAMTYNAQVYRDWWDLRPRRDVVLCVAPVFHITGIISGIGVALVTGIPVVLLHRFDAEETLRAVDSSRATFTVAASTAYIAMSTHPTLASYDITSLTKTLSGGAPVSLALVDRVRRATGWALHGAYGMTETNSPTHLGPPDAAPPVDPVSGSLAVGTPVPGCQVRIIDPASFDDLGPGEAGEILVRGPMVIPGYWDRPAESAEIIRDGWLHTGDIGKQDEDGWLFVIDRLKDLINAGGYKVFPRDVEEVLARHPAVLEVAVVGIPDEYRGETVKAYVVLVTGANVTLEELTSFCRERMAAYKYPRSIEFVGTLPKNAAGKILRRELRDRR